MKVLCNCIIFLQRTLECFEMILLFDFENQPIRKILFMLQNIRKKGKEIINFSIIIRCGKQGQSIQINMEKVKDIRSYLKDRKKLMLQSLFKLLQLTPRQELK